jgi:hypothetical protein
MHRYLFAFVPVSCRDKGVTAVVRTNVARLDPIWELTDSLIGMRVEANQPRLILNLRAADS